MARRNVETSVGDLLQALGLFIRHAPRRGSLARALSERVLRHGKGLLRRGPRPPPNWRAPNSVKPQSMGATIAALEERGIVERKPHPTDGRQVNIELTAKGAALRKSARDAKRTWVAEAIAHLDDEERETLFKAGDIIRRLVEK